MTRILGTIELGRKSLIAQDRRTKDEASFLFWPVDAIPIDEAPFIILQIVTAKKLVRKSMKLLKKICQGGLNHAYVYPESLIIEESPCY